jgi:hypothetical protein
MKRLEERRARASIRPPRRSRSFVGEHFDPSKLAEMMAAESDNSAGPENPMRRLSIESEMVDVMERWFAVKAARISDIRLKYGT